MSKNFKLIDWIDPDKLDWNELYKNYNNILNNNFQYSMEEEEFESNNIPELYCSNTDNRTHIIDLLEKSIDKFGKKSWDRLSSMSNDIDLLIENIDKINWNELCKNKSNKALELLKDNVDKLKKNGWINLCGNQNNIAMSIIDDNIHKLCKICWIKLSFNQCSIAILEKNINKIVWVELCKNPKALSIIEQYYNSLGEEELYYLCKNPIIVSLYEKNNLFKEFLIDNIDYNWSILCMNPYAIPIIENNLDKLDYDCWKNLSKNYMAINLLEKNKDKINWEKFSQNIGIFIYDYEYIKENNNSIKKSLAEYFGNPQRLKELGYFDILD